jgi:hypothetical protein
MGDIDNHSRWDSSGISGAVFGLSGVSMTQESIIYEGTIIGYIRKEWERGTTWYWGIVTIGNITYKEYWHDRKACLDWILWRRGLR